MVRQALSSTRFSGQWKRPTHTGIPDITNSSSRLDGYSEHSTSCCGLSRWFCLASARKGSPFSVRLGRAVVGHGGQACRIVDNSEVCGLLLPFTAALGQIFPLLLERINPLLDD